MDSEASRFSVARWREVVGLLDGEPDLPTEDVRQDRGCFRAVQRVGGQEVVIAAVLLRAVSQYVRRHRGPILEATQPTRRSQQSIENAPTHVSVRPVRFACKEFGWRKTTHPESGNRPESVGAWIDLRSRVP